MQSCQRMNYQITAVQANEIINLTTDKSKINIITNTEAGRPQIPQSLIDF